MSASTAAEGLRAGRAAVAAGVLMAVPVATELVWNVQRADGSPSNLLGWLLFIGSWGLGAGALLVALLGLGAELPRAGRLGRRICSTGAALLVAFAVVHLATGLVTGTPLEAAFWSFLVGFLLLVLGSVPFALGLRRAGAAPAVWISVLAAGAGGLVAIATQSPLHEVGMFTFDAAWIALGLALLTAVRSGTRRDVARTA